MFLFQIEFETECFYNIIVKMFSTKLRKQKQT